MPVSSDITAKIKQVTGVEDIDININKVIGIEPLDIASIAPAAIHVKELNNIDPLTLEPLRVNEVRNIDPLSIAQFNVTRLPTVNLSVRQLPAVDMNIRRLPPVSVGFYQDIHVPSDYQIRARVFGLEILRVNMSGHTTLIPKTRARQEQARTHDRSYPEVAAAGNPAIPSEHSERVVVHTSERSCAPTAECHGKRGRAGSATRPVHRRGESLSAGEPRHAFSLHTESDTSHGTIRSGD